MVKVFDLSKFLKDYEDLENSIYDILEKHKDCAQKIVNDIKEEFFSKIEKVEDNYFFLQLLMILLPAILMNYYRKIL